MTVYKCDCCGAEIPIIKKHTLFGEINVLKRGIWKCKEIDLSSLNRDTNILMCEACAAKYSAIVDYEVLKLRQEVLTNSVK